MAEYRYLIRINYKNTDRVQVWKSARSAAAAMVKAIEASKSKISHITNVCLVGEPIPVCQKRRRRLEIQKFPERAKRTPRPKQPSVFDI